jgi:hypothetical protein
MFGTWSGIPDRTTFTYSKQRIVQKPESVAARYRFDGDEKRLKAETVGPTGNERRGDPGVVQRNLKLGVFFD